MWRARTDYVFEYLGKIERGLIKCVTNVESEN